MDNGNRRHDMGGGSPAHDVEDLHTAPLIRGGMESNGMSNSYPRHPSYPPHPGRTSAPMPPMAPMPSHLATPQMNSAPDLAPYAPQHMPGRPTTVAEAELEVPFLAELALKHIVNAGVITGGDLAQRLHLPLAGVVEEAINALRRESLVEHISASATLLGSAGMKLRPTDRGAQTDRNNREKNGYVGPAPVSIRAYERMLRLQAMSERTVKRTDVWRRLSHLVLPDETIDGLGAGLGSGGPIFLHGHSGNGKTSIGVSIARMFGGGILVPHAVNIDGQIMRVFDPSVHQPLPLDPATTGTKIDERWVYCQVPFLRTGVDLKMHQLELHVNEQHHYYDCPIQLKAAGGVLLVDDLGGQQYTPEELLNRMLAPLATGTDYLTAVSGRQIPLPFTTLLVFATAKEPGEILSETLLRRLPCKLVVPDPTEDQYRELMRRACQSANLELTTTGFDYVIDRCYIRGNRSARACHPVELVRLIGATARYFGTVPSLSPQLIDMAADLYFV